jgi:hypothetical protein
MRFGAGKSWDGPFGLVEDGLAPGKKSPPAAAAPRTHNVYAFEGMRAPEARNRGPSGPERDTSEVTIGLKFCDVRYAKSLYDI